MTVGELRGKLEDFDQDWLVVLAFFDYSVSDIEEVDYDPLGKIEAGCFRTEQCSFPNHDKSRTLPLLMKTQGRNNAVVFWPG
jgi:hypothetical protein